MYRAKETNIGTTATVFVEKIPYYKTPHFAVKKDKNNLFSNYHEVAQISKALKLQRESRNRVTVDCRYEKNQKDSYHFIQLSLVHEKCAFLRVTERETERYYIR